MRIKELTFHNLGIIGDAKIPIEQPLNIFYGDILQGKTTVLNGVKLLFGGAYPADLIKHGKKEAFSEMLIDDEGVEVVIRREWYIDKKQKLTDRPLKFTRDGIPLSRPVQEIAKMLNPFLLDQDYLRNMGEAERKKFFVTFFGVDTTELDKENAKIAEEAKGLRIKIDTYGDIDLTPIASVDAKELKGELAKVRAAHTEAVDEWSKECATVNEHNANIKRGKEKMASLEAERDGWIEQVKQLEKQIADHNVKVLEIYNWIQKHPAKEFRPQPPAPDTAGIEKQIEEAAAQNVRAEQYRKNKERDALRIADQRRLVQIENRQRDIKKAKTAKLAEIAVNSKVKGLEFDEEGSFTYDGTSAGMLSTAQLMKLSSEVAALYPPGLSISLLDRGESLGTSIFEYIKYAKEKNTTVLATVVGQKPAETPEGASVFVVKDGVVMKDQTTKEE